MSETETVPGKVTGGSIRSTQSRADSDRDGGLKEDMTAAAECVRENVGDSGRRRCRSGSGERAGGSRRQRQRPVVEMGIWRLEDFARLFLGRA